VNREFEQWWSDAEELLVDAEGNLILMNPPRRVLEALITAQKQDLEATRRLRGPLRGIHALRMHDLANVCDTAGRLAEAEAAAREAAAAFQDAGFDALADIALTYYLSFFTRSHRDGAAAAAAVPLVLGEGAAARQPDQVPPGTAGTMGSLYLGAGLPRRRFPSWRAPPGACRG